MGRIRKKKTSLTKIIIKSIFLLGLFMIFISCSFLVLLALLQQNQLVSPDLLPRVELMLFFVYPLLMIVIIFFISHLTARRIQKKGQALIDVTHKIQEQDLNFEVEPTGILEIDKVLNAMDDLKCALSNSLASQWELEQNKQLQLSALMHDLKAPITILKGNLYLLNYENLSDEGHKALEDMESCLTDMEAYTKELLEISKYRMKETTAMEFCDLKSLLKDVISSMQVLFDTKKIILDLHLTPDSIWVMGNSNELKRSIQNVLSNAIDFSPQGSQIQIILQTQEATVLLSIRDSGQGFSEEALKHAKEQFYMSDTSRNRQKHYGLGLFITEEILRKHQGQLLLMNDETKHGGKVILQLPKLEK